MRSNLYIALVVDMPRVQTRSVAVDECVLTLERHTTAGPRIPSALVETPSEVGTLTSTRHLLIGLVKRL